MYWQQIVILLWFALNFTLNVHALGKGDPVKINGITILSSLISYVILTYCVLTLA